MVEGYVSTDHSGSLGSQPFGTEKNPWLLPSEKLEYMRIFKANAMAEGYIQR
jgi:hypothetical protein